ncbi:hypothetical protein OB920_07030 [Halobacteria archaeon HArc-gm2]|nr:hypothetical protein [Halobacteria archaeon HArc-gm2]
MTDGSDRHTDVENLETAGPLPEPGRGDDASPTVPARNPRDDGDEPRTPDASHFVAVLASTTGFEAAVWVLLRYVPEYLQATGVGAPAIGAFGTFWLAARWFGRGRNAPARWRVIAGAAAAAVGLSLWALIPELVAGSAVTAWLLVAAGGVGVAAWAHAGPDGPVGQWSLDDGDGTATPDRAGWALAALAPSVAIFALARSFQAGYRVSLALAAALGLTVAVLWAAGGLDVSPPGRSSSRPRRRASLGDVVGRFGLTTVSLFVVVAVTSLPDLSVVVLGRRLAPAATFGLFLAAELVTGAAVARVGPRVVDAVGVRAATAYASVAAAAFPLLVVTAPASPLVFGALFAVYGSRSLGRVARERAEALPEPAEALPARAGADRDDSAPDRRELLVATAPLLGGVLYAVNPVLAFGAATAIGAVGGWERVRAVDADASADR